MVVHAHTELISSAGDLDSSTSGATIAVSMPVRRRTNDRKRKSMDSDKENECRGGNAHALRDRACPPLPSKRIKHDLASPAPPPQQTAQDAV